MFLRPNTLVKLSVEVSIHLKCPVAKATNLNVDKAASNTKA